MEKRGDLSLSFGMIFSIIIIVAVIAIAAFIIVKFLATKNCIDSGIFYNELQERVDRAWGSTIAEDPESFKVPSGVKSICIRGNSSSANSEYEEEYEELKDYLRTKRSATLFVYPPNNACEGKVPYYKLEHIKLPTQFFCIEAKNGELDLILQKESNEPLVRIVAGT